MQDAEKYDRIRDPFSARAAADFSTTEEEQFIDVTSDPTMRLQFKFKTLAAFWIGVAHCVRYGILQLPQSR